MISDTQLPTIFETLFRCGVSPFNVEIYGHTGCVLFYSHGLTAGEVHEARMHLIACLMNLD